MADTSTNPTDWGAAEIARRIARHEVSSVEVVRAHIARIEQVDQRLNAVIVRRFEEARLEAAAADARLLRGESPGPLHGVPITIKECFHLAGTQATIGLDTKKGQLSPDDGILVQRLRKAGAIVLGKTNVPQMMIWHECANPVYGRTNNPWDLGRTPGGSTGGEGAIVAARGSPLGLGNDLGGSIRIPAHFCGIHGLKPTSFRLPRVGSVATLRGLEAIVSQPGPMAREVEDLWLGLQVMADDSDGFVAGDVAPGKLGDPAAVDMSKLTIGMVAGDFIFPASKALTRAVREAARRLRDCGATIVEIDPQAEHSPFGNNEVLDLYCSLIASDGGADARRLARGAKLDWRVSRLDWLAGLRPLPRGAVVGGLRAAGQRWTARIVAEVRARSADAFRFLTWQKQQLAARAIEGLRRRGIDAILCPPHALPATQHIKGFDLLPAASYAFLFNLLGWPAGVISTTRVRAGEDSGRTAGRDQVERQAVAVDRGSVGLPVGVQVAALPWREDIVLAIMLQLEREFRDNADYPGRQRVPV